MASTYKILGQSAPAATTETTLYTAPLATSTIISTVTVCNQAASPATFRIAVRPSAEGTTLAKHWIVYGATVDASDSTFLTLGLTIGPNDKVQIYSSSATMSFSAFGSEIV